MIPGNLRIMRSSKSFSAAATQNRKPKRTSIMRLDCTACSLTAARRLEVRSDAILLQRIAERFSHPASNSIRLAARTNRGGLREKCFRQHGMLHIAVDKLKTGDAFDEVRKLLQ